MAKARALRPFQAKREPDLWGSVMRREWIIALRIRKICPVVQRRALLFLVRVTPGTRDAIATNEDCWEAILKADQAYREATNTQPVGGL